MGKAAAGAGNIDDFAADKRCLDRLPYVYNFATKQNDVNEWVSCILMLQKDLYIYTL